jgi:hypothetical protein
VTRSNEEEQRMSDTSKAADDFNHPSQAEGEDPMAADQVEVLPETGKPSQAEGGDPDTEAEEVEVLPEVPADGAD